MSSTTTIFPIKIVSLVNWDPVVGAERCDIKPCYIALEKGQIYAPRLYLNSDMRRIPREIKMQASWRNLRYGYALTPKAAETVGGHMVGPIGFAQVNWPHIPSMGTTQCIQDQKTGYWYGPPCIFLDFVHDSYTVTVKTLTDNGVKQFDIALASENIFAGAPLANLRDIVYCVG